MIMLLDSQRAWNFHNLHALSMSKAPSDRAAYGLVSGSLLPDLSKEERVANARVAYGWLMENMPDRETAEKLQRYIINELKASGGGMLTDLAPASGKSAADIRLCMQDAVDNADFRRAKHFYDHITLGTALKSGYVLKPNALTFISATKELRRVAGTKFSELEPGKREEEIEDNIRHSLGDANIRTQGYVNTAKYYYQAIISGAFPAETAYEQLTRIKENIQAAGKDFDALPNEAHIPAPAVKERIFTAIKAKNPQAAFVDYFPEEPKIEKPALSAIRSNSNPVKETVR